MMWFIMLFLRLQLCVLTAAAGHAGPHARHKGRGLDLANPYAQIMSQICLLADGTATDEQQACEAAVYDSIRETSDKYCTLVCEPQQPGRDSGFADCGNCWILS